MRKLTEFDYMLDSYDSQDQYLEDLRSEFVNSFPILNCQIKCNS